MRYLISKTDPMAKSKVRAAFLGTQPFAVVLGMRPKLRHLLQNLRPLHGTIMGVAASWMFAGAPIMAAEDSAEGTVRIRVTNISAVPYTDVTIRFPSQTENYGALQPGASSEYRDIAIAFRYASATLVTGGRPHRVLAADYLGETRLNPGSYTYTLDLAGGTPRFGLIVDSE